MLLKQISGLTAGKRSLHCSVVVRCLIYGSKYRRTSISLLTIENLVCDTSASMGLCTCETTLLRLRDSEVLEYLSISC